MNLPEAIALMLEGKVMVDGNDVPHRIMCVSGFKPDPVVALPKRWTGSYWRHTSTFRCNGWREATPEELKEIGL